MPYIEILTYLRTQDSNWDTRPCKYIFYFISFYRNVDIFYGDMCDAKLALPMMFWRIFWFEKTKNVCNFPICNLNRMIQAFVYLSNNPENDIFIVFYRFMDECYSASMKKFTFTYLNLNYKYSISVWISIFGWIGQQ